MKCLQAEDAFDQHPPLRQHNGPQWWWVRCWRECGEKTRQLGRQTTGIRRCSQDDDDRSEAVGHNSFRFSATASDIAMEHTTPHPPYPPHSPPPTPMRHLILKPNSSTVGKFCPPRKYIILSDCVANRSGARTSHAVPNHASHYLNTSYRSATSASIIVPLLLLFVVACRTNQTHYMFICILCPHCLMWFTANFH